MEAEVHKVLFFSFSLFLYFSFSLLLFFFSQLFFLRATHLHGIASRIETGFTYGLQLRSSFSRYKAAGEGEEGEGRRGVERKERREEAGEIDSET